MTKKLNLVLWDHKDCSIKHHMTVIHSSENYLQMVVYPSFVVEPEMNLTNVSNMRPLSTFGPPWEHWLWAEHMPDMGAPKIGVLSWRGESVMTLVTYRALKQQKMGRYLKPCLTSRKGTVFLVWS